MEIPQSQDFRQETGMRQYFEYNYEGPGFELFGTGHLAALAIIAGACAFLIWGWKNPSDAAKRNMRLLLLGVFLLAESSWHGWNLWNDAWTIQRHLPLHSCSIRAWCSIYILLTRSYRVYEIIFFIGTAGAIQTVLTPDAGAYGLPHFRAIQTLAAHGLIIVTIVFMTAIEGYRPTWRSLWKTMLLANIYLVIVTSINFLLGSNYMYTLRKPATASLLDHMGPWPWYILTGELVALAMFTLLYLPIALADRRARVSEIRT
jgi:hypothetical integral membrane protein (TIGR02206 family)